MELISSPVITSLTGFNNIRNMAYTVALPKNKEIFAKNSLFQSLGPLLNKTGETGETGDEHHAAVPNTIIANVSIEYPNAYPQSVRINEAVIITEVAKFVSVTVGELEHHVAVINVGKNTWLGKFYLVGEKIEKLSRCGVKVTIEGLDYQRASSRSNSTESGSNGPGAESMI